MQRTEPREIPHDFKSTLANPPKMPHADSRPGRCKICHLIAIKVPCRKAPHARPAFKGCCGTEFSAAIVEIEQYPAIHGGGGSEVCLAITIEVHCQHRTQFLRARPQVQRCGESSATLAGQDRDRPVQIACCEVRLAVPVEVRGGDSLRPFLMIIRSHLRVTHRNTVGKGLEIAE